MIIIQNNDTTRGDGNGRPYWLRRDELSVQDGCILWGNRIVVPFSVRKYFLNELLESHPGTSRMKSLGRMFVRWPGFDADVERWVRECNTCQRHMSAPPVVPLQPWQWPSKQWSRIHIDFAGP